MGTASSPGSSGRAIVIRRFAGSTKPMVSPGKCARFSIALRTPSPPECANCELNLTDHKTKMSAPVTEIASPNGSATTTSPTAPASTAPTAPALPADRKGLTKKEISADHPTWCPGCGDFSVLALYFKLIEKRKMWHEKVTTIAGIGCSSRFPYFVQAHGAHYIHGRALPFASGISLSRPDLHVFVFGGDGDAFSIGGNHFNHTARKNIKMSYVVMDNWVYGLTKKQTSPTSPLGFKSKTDVTGAVDYPINPMKQAIAAGATFVARTTHSNPNHVLQKSEGEREQAGGRVFESGR